MSGSRVLALALLIIVDASRGDETTQLPSSTTSTTTASTTTGILEIPGGTNDKIARRIIDDRLTPPRATDFAPWNKKLPLGEVHRAIPNGPPPRVTEQLDDNVTERGVPKKTRTVGTPQDGNCCPGKSEDRAQTNPGSEATDLERPAARFHGSRPSDDSRYGHGWRSSSYLGFGKDKGYYDQRNQYPYDRYGTAQRPSASYSQDGDRYGSSSSSRPGNYQSANYGYGIGGGGGSSGGPYDRPRPGSGGYGITGNVAGEGDTDYPFGEGGPPGGGPPSATNLQTQKAVALKALAGVALIGAAAALASNPVLLPISVISGRRKRSVHLDSDNFALTALLQGYIRPNLDQVKTSESAEGQIQRNGSQELVISPRCVARLACHVHRDYLDELEKSRAELKSVASSELTAAQGNTTRLTDLDESAFQGLEHWFDGLIHSNILAADYLSDEIKSLIRSAVSVGSNKNASCDQFSCLNVHETSSRKST